VRDATPLSRRCEVRRQRFEHIRRLYERNLALAARLRDQTAARHGIRDPSLYTPVILPANRRPVVPLGRRRYRFASRLVGFFAEARVAPLPPPPFDPNEGGEHEGSSPALSKACAVCGGHCCLTGGTSAHLDAHSVARHMDRHPELGARAVLASYCRRLPTRTHRGACVFQAASGCGLPPDMRPPVCRSYLCSGLIELRDRIGRDGETRFFLAAADERGIARAEFLTVER